MAPAMGRPAGAVSGCPGRTVPGHGRCAGVRPATSAQGLGPGLRPWLPFPSAPRPVPRALGDRSRTRSGPAQDRVHGARGEGGPDPVGGRRPSRRGVGRGTRSGGVRRGRLHHRTPLADPAGAHGPLPATGRADPTRGGVPERGPDAVAVRLPSSTGGSAPVAAAPAVGNRPERTWGDLGAVLAEREPGPRAQTGVGRTPTPVPLPPLRRVQSDPRTACTPAPGGRVRGGGGPLAALGEPSPSRAPVIPRGVLGEPTRA